MIKILKLIVWITIFGTFSYADDITIQLLRDIEFRNGFGQIEAKPVLKGVSKDIKVMGEYNVEEKSGNVVIKLDKVLYGGNIYNLSEEFSTKRRLKNPKTAKLSKNSKIKLSGGSHPEVLAILNGEAESNSKESKGKSNNSQSATNEKSSTSSDYVAYDRGYGSNSSSNYPYYYPNTNNNSSSNKDYSSPTQNADGSCKSPEVRDGMVYVYPAVNGVCTQKTTAEANIYKKSNTSTCPNKIDYDNKNVSVGEEYYTIIDDTEYKVKSCEYKDNLALQQTTENCQIIPDFKNKQGRIQKQYWYILNNEKINVGSCVPTNETIALYDDDYNSCKYRFDFENNKAIKQTQWYYIYENERETIGDCVDVDDEKIASMTYPMFENAQGCKCNTIDGEQICQTKLSFSGLSNEKVDATECRYIDTGGVKLIDEFVGNYAFKDDSKQAIKKINQYFIGAGGEKVYLTKDKETNQVFPYDEISCGWQHDEDKKLSYHKTRIIIKDPELLTIDTSSNPKIDGDEYEVKSCQAVKDIVLYWQQQLDLVRGKKTTDYTRQVLVPENLSPTATKWSIPLIKTKNADGVQVEATLESGQKPIWSSNFKADSLELKKDFKENSKRFGGQSHPSTWNYNYSDSDLTLNEVPSLPKNFSIGWEWKWVKTGQYTKVVYVPSSYNENNGSTSPAYWYCNNTQNSFFNTNPYQYYKKYTNANDIKQDSQGYCLDDSNNRIPMYSYSYVGLNNPLNADTKLTTAYSIVLSTPIIIKPTEIKMNENLTDNGNLDGAIRYKEIEKEIIDPNTGQCVKEEGESNEYLLDEKGNPKLDKDGNKIKNPNYNANAGKCKTEKVWLFSTGVEFTPNYDNVKDSNNQQFCKAGESQSFESIEEKVYEPREPSEDEEYYDYIQSIKNEALNINNYSKNVSKVLCTSSNDNTDSNMNAYIIGAVTNHYKPNIMLTKLEIESLKDMSLRLDTQTSTRKTYDGLGNTLPRYHKSRTEWVRVNFSTKDNWANNQSIYQYEMYRPYRRPDGTTFHLYEREGFYSTPQSIECADCYKDKFD